MAKDKQKNQQQDSGRAASTTDVVREAPQRAQEMDGSAPEKGVTEAQNREDSERVEALSAERERLRKDLEAVGKDLEAVGKAARHGNPPEAFQPTTEQGKAALAEVAKLGGVARSQREANARHMPESGWSSPRARELVAAVPAEQRALLLGDLLAMLAPHAGETGANETAADVLRRKMAEHTTLRGGFEMAEIRANDAERQAKVLSEEVQRFQAAMVARRAPDAESGNVLDHIAVLLAPYTPDGADPAPRYMAGILEVLLRQRAGLLEFFSPLPMVAVAVRDDSTPKLSERYSLLLLEWDGTKSSVTVLEERSPWADLARLLGNTVSTRLVPPPFR